MLGLFRVELCWLGEYLSFALILSVLYIPVLANPLVYMHLY